VRVSARMALTLVRRRSKCYEFVLIVR
jgi:hypothetical protein